MNYVNEQNMKEILDGIARKIGQGGTGSGLEDWQAEKEYIEKDICVYEGQIYRAKVGYTSDTTFSTTQILEEYTPVGGETIIPYEQDTEISIDDIVSYDNNTYKALYNFVCGEEFTLYALEEYVPQELTEVQEAEIINHFMPNIYSGGNMSIEDSTPIGTIISFMGTIAPENYLVCDGETYNIADYIELAEFIKTQFGSYNYFGGDGITTFAVPDLQGEFLRMTGTNSHENQGSGANVGVHQDATESKDVAIGGSNELWVNSEKSKYLISKYDSRFNAKETTTRNYYTRSSTGTQNDDNRVTYRPTNTSVLYCIKYKMSITNAEEIKDLTTEDIKQIINSYNPVFEEAKGIEYSTEERRIGTWIDGKPLYQKTIEINNITINAYQPYEIDTTSLLDNEHIAVVNMFGGYYTDFSTNYQQFHNWTTEVAASSDDVWSYTIYYKQIFKILCINGTWGSNASHTLDKGYITLQYTKTTD